LEAGRIYEIDTTLPFIGQLLNTGERLRFTVCSAAAGDYFPNRNTGNDFPEDTGKMIAHTKVHFGEATPSSVTFYRETILEGI